MHRLAATGAARGCNPDRVVLKKAILSGFPVRVHKRKALVRHMFHNPDDVRWFKPLVRCLPAQHSTAQHSKALLHANTQATANQFLNVLDMQHFKPLCARATSLSTVHASSDRLPGSKQVVFPQGHTSPKAAHNACAGIVDQVWASRASAGARGHAWRHEVRF
jgi:hypothetical protein